MTNETTLKGIFPILATCFKEDESIDYKSQERLIDYCINKGVHGLVTLANASEGHLMNDEEKKKLLSFVIKKTDNRVPVVVAVNHPSSFDAAKMAVYAEREGAGAVMCMPPFFGRWRSGIDEITTYFNNLNDAVNIPIILQDHRLSDIALSVNYLISLSNRLENLKYVKLEFGNIIHKARELLLHSEGGLAAVFGGNSGVFFPEEYEAGCRGTMPACYMPEVFRKTWDLLGEGRREESVRFFTPFSRLAAYEKDVANQCLWKIVLHKKGVIDSAKTREPVPSFLNKWNVEQFLQLASDMGIEY